LELLRVGLLAAFDEASVGVKAQVASQLRGVIKELAELPESKDANPVDEFTAARESRRRATA
jgi:hypothetical protein